MKIEQRSLLPAISREDIPQDPQVQPDASQGDRDPCDERRTFTLHFINLWKFR